MTVLREESLEARLEGDSRPLPCAGPAFRKMKTNSGQHEASRSVSVSDMW